ncbi:hypothetical protein LOTGIDRAFT_126473 [Lottia gigantea]|uniref:DNA polymerase kappa n=1 Tax=Lottia gigantea TaxID=225164 RepID=V4BHH4_LOTGI|nr:hypothetical protein LOTGIDRAFT_126473 [Lottia gigantea]ESO88104.1 hypothetical protein LOTGIDRAFT_126473 [Lottia gigantea]
MNTDSPDTSKQKSDSVSKPSSLMTRMELNDHKAGMEGLDKAKINQIIYEASKGSKYFENEKKKEEQVKERIEEQKRRMEKITAEQLQHGLKQADGLLSELESLFDLSRYIVHVDMDAFYAAVEMRDNPSLRYKPMAVGGMGMLSTSNYLARKFGVRAAMPGFIGLKLCPNLILVKSNQEKYSAVSKEIRAIMVDYDPNYCPLSLDEAYLDFTDHMKTRETSSDKDRSFLVKNCSVDDESKCMYSTQFSNSSQIEKEMLLICPVCNKPYPPYEVKLFDKDIEDAVNEMRCRIEQRTRLTASAGIAPNMMLAKVCSDKNKPNGQYRIQACRDSIKEFIDDLPIRKISGIGKISEQMLNALGVVKCRDLYQHRSLLYHLYSDISFHYFMRICLGLGSTTVERDSERKSMSTERTFRDMSNPSDLYDKCLELSESLSKDLNEEGLKGKTVTLKIKTSTFEVKTRAQTIPDYIWDQETIYNTCKELLRIEIANAQPKPLTLRLMGKNLLICFSLRILVAAVLAKYPSLI